MTADSRRNDALSLERCPIRLSRRERQLFDLVSQGFSNKEIASALTLTEGTVKVYLSRLFRKAGVRDRLELALLGLLSRGGARTAGAGEG